jgi:hypothetical protein
VSPGALEVTVAFKVHLENKPLPVGWATPESPAIASVETLDEARVVMDALIKQGVRNIYAVGWSREATPG